MLIISILSQQLILLIDSGENHGVLSSGSDLKLCEIKRTKKKVQLKKHTIREKLIQMMSS